MKNLKIKAIHAPAKRIGGRRVSASLSPKHFSSEKTLADGHWGWKNAKIQQHRDSLIKAHKYKEYQFLVVEPDAVVLSKSDMHKKSKRARATRRNAKCEKWTRGAPKGRSNRNFGIVQPRKAGCYYR